MRRYDGRQTTRTFSMRVAAEHGVTDPRHVEWAVWERTGYPEFWHIPEDGANGLECFDKQLGDYFSGRYYCGRCGTRMPADDGALNLCDVCTVLLA